MSFLFFFLGAGLASLIPSAFAMEAPRRVVTLIPSLTEIAEQLLKDSPERLVGVAEAPDGGGALALRKSVGPFHQFDVEKVVSLRPDLVLASRDGNPRERVEQLVRLGVQVLVTDSNSLGAIRDAIEKVSNALRTPEAGSALLKSWDQSIQGFRQRAAERSRVLGGAASPRVLIQLDHQPLVFAGAGTFLDEGLRVLGARNALSGKTDIKYPRPSLEWAVALDPDAVIITGMGSKRSLEPWSTLSTVPVVKNGRIFSVDSLALTRPGIRFPEGLLALEKTLFSK